MANIKLLDCTLRDGGYVNNWRFGHAHAVSIFRRLVNAEVDIIEVGFLDERHRFDIDRTIMPDTLCTNKIFGALDKGNTLAVGMIDYGTCPLSHIAPAEGGFLDGIRVIFKKHLCVPALAFCAELKRLGYRVFAQAVSTTDYTDEELVELARLTNDCAPNALSIVDTYGLMQSPDVLHRFDLLEEYLNKEIAIGFHAHNNLQLAYANCAALLAHTRDSMRTLILDGSLHGMGKSAGNAPLELLGLHLNRYAEKNYRLPEMLSAIDADILPFYEAPTWGYKLFYFLAAAGECHPAYVAYLMEHETLFTAQIYELLTQISAEHRLTFDKNAIEPLYREHLRGAVHSTEKRDTLLI